MSAQRKSWEALISCQHSFSFSLEVYGVNVWPWWFRHRCSKRPLRFHERSARSIEVMARSICRRLSTEFPDTTSTAAVKEKRLVSHWLMHSKTDEISTVFFSAFEGWNNCKRLLKAFSQANALTGSYPQAKKGFWVGQVCGPVVPEYYLCVYKHHNAALSTMYMRCHRPRFQRWRLRHPTDCPAKLRALIHWRHVRTAKVRDGCIVDSREARRGETLLSFNCLGRLFVLIDDSLQPLLERCPIAEIGGTAELSREALQFLMLVMSCCHTWVFQ